MNSSLGPLQDKGRVAIIGGGPGGAACAIALQRTAAKMNISLQITVLEGKQFSGERHHNQCVGVLSPPLASLLEEKLDVQFPFHLGRAEIQAYILHTARGQINLAENGVKSIALRRVQFDNFFLETVRKRGITVISARAVALEFHDNRVVVYTESGSVDCDVVVGAFGMDEGTSALFASQTKYRSPQALNSIVTKYHPSQKSMEELGPNIHAFLPNHPKIEFGAITPKGNHLTINIAGRAVDVSFMEDFLNDKGVRSLLPDMDAQEQLEEGDFTIL